MCKFSISEKMIYAARNGDKVAMNELIAALAPTVETIASVYVGRCPLTRSDLVQEGMIGLLSSVHGYSPCGCAEFRTYATTCVSNRIMSAVRNQLRDKHTPLNAYVLIDDVSITDNQADPQIVLDMQEKMNNLNRRIEEDLTPLERNVLRLHIGGHDYNSIAIQLSVSTKSVDNALQRARKKLKEE